MFASLYSHHTALCSLISHFTLPKLCGGLHTTHSLAIPLKIVSTPWREFFKLGGLSGILLLVGTLPFIDNWSHIGGFVFGIVSGIVFLPYVTFGDWDLKRKRILLMICIPTLLLMIVLAFLTFYRLQTTTFCSWCKYLNCIPYTSEIQCS